MESDKKEIICKNKYKNDDIDKRRKEFTQKWVDLINRKEKSYESRNLLPPV